MAQTEYITQMLEQVLPQLGDIYNRVVFDMDGSFEEAYDQFDEVYPAEHVNKVMTDMMVLIKGVAYVEKKTAAENAMKPVVEPLKIGFNLFDDDPELAAFVASDEDEVEEKEEIIEEVPVEVDKVEEATYQEMPDFKTPMLVYIPYAQEFLDKVNLDDSDAKAFIKNAKDVGIHLIFHLPVSSMTTMRAGLGKYLKEMTRTGFVGQRSTDQQFINVKTNYGEAQMGDGEHSYFDKKMIERVRTIGMSD